MQFVEPVGFRKQMVLGCTCSIPSPARRAIVAKGPKLSKDYWTKFQTLIRAELSNCVLYMSMFMYRCTCIDVHVAGYVHVHGLYNTKIISKISVVECHWSSNLHVVTCTCTCSF